MTAAEAEDYLLSLELFGMRFGLARMRRLMTAMGHPERRFEAIHVVGSNGKSSTVRMIAALLEAHGRRAGAYLSPHLTSFAERIRVGGADLSPERLGAAVERARRAAEKVDRNAAEDDRVTQFEALTAAAYGELASQEVEVAVIEAGLGGRYDATNVLAAPVCVLTNVGLEHQRWLGPTVTDIAREKLAVVPPGGTLICGADLAPAVDAEVARLDANVVRAPADPDAWNIGGPIAPQTDHASYQRRNLATAMAAAEAYLGELDGAAVRVAARTTVPGRMQKIADEPTTILDGAHNPAGIQALMSSFDEPFIAVVGVLEDKDAAEMLRGLASKTKSIVFTKPANPRALSPATLKSLWAQVGGDDAEIVGDPKEALERARELAGPQGTVLATGSIYLIADLLREPGQTARASTL